MLSASLLPFPFPTVTVFSVTGIRLELVPPSARDSELSLCETFSTANLEGCCTKIGQGIAALQVFGDTESLMALICQVILPSHIQNALVETPLEAQLRERRPSEYISITAAQSHVLAPACWLLLVQCCMPADQGFHPYATSSNAQSPCSIHSGRFCGS